MTSEYPQLMQLELFPELQPQQPKTRSKRLPSKGKQSLDKPLVPCPIKIERIGIVKRTNTPYIVYRTEYGRCCTFVSRRYLIESLFHLLDITQAGLGKVKNFGISEYTVTVRAGKNLHTIADCEVFAYLERQNQVEIARLVVKLLGNQIGVWNPQTGKYNTVSKQGCTCEDTPYHRSFCQHRIAAHLDLQKQGWGSLVSYLAQDYGAIQTEEWLAIAS